MANPTVFISYCWQDKALVEDLEKDLKILPFNIRRDVYDVQYRDNLEKFMKSIRDDDFALILVTDSFFKSRNCMYELSELRKEQDFKTKYLPILPPKEHKSKPKIFKPIDRLTYVKYWENEIRKLKEELKTTEPENVTESLKDLRKYQEIVRNLETYIKDFSGHLVKRIDQLKAENYKTLLDTMGLKDPSLETKIYEKVLKIYQIQDQEEQDLALEDFRKIYENNALPFRLSGEVFYNRKQYRKSLHYYDRAIENDPNYAQAYSNRGVVLSKLGRPEEALASYNQAIENDPNYAQAYYNRGNVLSKLGRLEEALASFNQALKEDPHDAEAYYNRGNVLSKLGRLEEALSSYNQAIENDPHFAEAYYNRGNVLSKLGRPEEALSSYNQAIENDPNYAQAYAGKYVIHLGQGKEETATEMLKKVQELNPELAGQIMNSVQF